METEKEEGRRDRMPNDFWRKFNFASVTSKQSGTLKALRLKARHSRRPRNTTPRMRTRGSAGGGSDAAKERRM